MDSDRTAAIDGKILNSVEQASDRMTDDGMQNPIGGAGIGYATR